MLTSHQCCTHGTQAMTTLRLEEEAPVTSPGGWHATVRIKQIEKTPGGSERILRSESYRFRQAPPNETDSHRQLRLGVRRDAKRRAMNKFDPDKVAQTRAKRSKRDAAASGVPAPSATASQAALPVTPAGALRWGGLLPAFGSPELLNPHDLTTERDLAILRGFKQEKSPVDVLNWLRLSGLDDEEPWTEQRVIERHDFLRRSVRTVARLVGPAVVAASMHDLVALCM